MLELLKGLNLLLRFLLELCALGALCYWGFTTGSGPVAKIGLGIGAPIIAVVVWGTFVAPGAPVAIPEALRLVLELVVFGSAVGALYSAGSPTLAWTPFDAGITGTLLLLLGGVAILMYPRPHFGRPSTRVPR